MGGFRLHQACPGWNTLLAGLAAALLVLSPASAVCSGREGQELDLDFEIPAVENKPYELNGYLEMKETVLGLDRGALLYQQRYAGQELDDKQYITNLTMKIEGKARSGIATAYARYRADGQRDALEGWSGDGTLEEGFLSLKPSTPLTIEAGKRVMKWGKGYAWNPAAFVSRPKDPNDPEETLEGYGMFDIDYILSLDGPLSTVAFTGVLLPVTDKFNKEWGEPNALIAAAKLYFLYYDTDMDVMLLTGEDVDTRFGFDFARNITTNFEVHGEAAITLGQSRFATDSLGNLREQSKNSISYLAGLRYLNQFDTTFILEYYRNGQGYSESEMNDYYSLIQRGLTFSPPGMLTNHLAKSRQYGQNYYNFQTVMQNYLYLRISQKEPFNILYFTPAVTTILNVDDGSLSISPEVLYAPVTNWEVRLKATVLAGQDNTEYGEKVNDYRLEARLRHYF